MRPSARGFTLIELLVVVTLIAIATATVSLALRDPASAQLEREGERLITLLETARAEARAAALPVRWQPVLHATSTPAGTLQPHFRFLGLPASSRLPTRWLDEPPVVTIEGQHTELTLGPEPLIPAQGLRLQQGSLQLRIATDGLKPFTAEWLEGGS